MAEDREADVALLRVDDLASFLRGGWTLERELTTLDGHPLGRFRGHATVDPEPAGPGTADTDATVVLVHRERGWLRLVDAPPVEATRTLRYAVTGPTARVRFEDGRDFHELDLRTGRCDVDHPCGADRYRGELVVEDPDTWRQTWTVRGPTKGYRSTTRHRRSGAAPAPSPAVVDLGQELVEP